MNIDDYLSKDELARSFNDILENYEKLNGAVLIYDIGGENKTITQFHGTTPNIFGLLQIGSMVYEDMFYEAQAVDE